MINLSSMINPRSGLVLLVLLKTTTLTLSCLVEFGISIDINRCASLVPSSQPESQMWHTAQLS